MRATSPNARTTPSDVIARASARLRTALALHDSGVALKRAQLRRRYPEDSDGQVAERLALWLRTRPGAPYGDAEGEPKIALKTLAED